MGANLNDRPGFDEGGDFFPPLAVFLEALEEETVFFGRPSAGVFDLAGGWVDGGDGVGLGGGGLGAGTGGVCCCCLGWWWWVGDYLLSDILCWRGR